jgi:hypothetical protein
LQVLQEISKNFQLAIFSRNLRPAAAKKQNIEKVRQQRNISHVGRQAVFKGS